MLITSNGLISIAGSASGMVPQGWSDIPDMVGCVPIRRYLNNSSFSPKYLQDKAQQQGIIHTWLELWHLRTPALYDRLCELNSQH